jgi:hypothetical protein
MYSGQEIHGDRSILGRYAGQRCLAISNTKQSVMTVKIGWTARMSFMVYCHFSNTLVPSSSLFSG